MLLYKLYKFLNDNISQLTGICVGETLGVSPTLKGVNIPSRQSCMYNPTMHSVQIVKKDVKIISTKV